MSINEAICILEEYISTLTNRKLIQALMKAINALRVCRDTKLQQQARKVITNCNGKKYCCPACKRIIPNLYKIRKSRYSYCDKCGQKLDWKGIR